MPRTSVLYVEVEPSEQEMVDEQSGAKRDEQEQ